jgi:hypothetical protein
MNAGEFSLSSPFRVSGILLIAGLCVEGVSLFWVHPLAFLSFFIVGGALLGAGVLLYLYSIVFHPTANIPSDSQSP